MQRHLGELEPARANQQRALAIKEAVYGAEHPQVAITLTNLGIVQEELGELEPVRATLQRALWPAVRHEPHAAVPVNGLLALVAGAIMLLLRTPLQEPLATRGCMRLRVEIVEGMRWLWQRPFLRTAALAGGAANVTWAALDIVLIVRAKKHGPRREPSAS